MRIRHHVNPLRLWRAIDRPERIELPAKKEAKKEIGAGTAGAGAGAEVEVEVGCAEGLFLLGRAQQDPSRLEVGIEIRHELVKALNTRAEREGLAVRAVFANANLHLSSVLASRSVARLFVNFPDPWFKRRHHKRRMLDSALARDCHQVLRPGGELFFQSDVFAVALEAMEILERLDDCYVNRAGPWSFWKAGNPYGVCSRREAHCQALGRPIWRLLYNARG
ncbi:MAG: tRNA (guanosine(46)-N7)-methyltransferase TrmB [Pseudomonadota bacterium]